VLKLILSAANDMRQEKVAGYGGLTSSGDAAADQLYTIYNGHHINTAKSRAASKSLRWRSLIRIHSRFRPGKGNRFESGNRRKRKGKTALPQIWKNASPRGEAALSRTRFGFLSQYLSGGTPLLLS
jgi:hypothetical protein